MLVRLSKNETRQAVQDIFPLRGLTNHILLLHLHGQNIVGISNNNGSSKMHTNVFFPSSYSQTQTVLVRHTEAFI